MIAREMYEHLLPLCLETSFNDKEVAVKLWVNSAGLVLEKHCDPFSDHAAGTAGATDFWE